MQLAFNKELLENHYLPEYGRLEWCSKFTITAADGKEAGRFFNSDEVSFFTFGQEDMRIDYVRKWLRRTQYPIINRKTNQVVGSYDRRRYTSPLSPYGKLLLGDALYVTQKTDHISSKGDKREHITIWVGNLSEAVTYQLKVTPRNGLLTGRTIGHAPFEGEIELKGSNMLLLFAGLFLVQQVVDFEDED